MRDRIARPIVADRFRFLVALPASGDLLLLAKHLFVDAIGWPIAQRRRAVSTTLLTTRQVLVGRSAHVAGREDLKKFQSSQGLGGQVPRHIALRRSATSALRALGARRAPNTMGELRGA